MAEPVLFEQTVGTLAPPSATPAIPSHSDNFRQLLTRYGRGRLRGLRTVTARHGFIYRNHVLCCVFISVGILESVYFRGIRVCFLVPA